MTWTEGQIDGVVVRPAKKNGDPRGWLCEIYRTDEIAGELTPVMGYVSVTHPGVTRGPHEHHQQTDIFGFLGPGGFKLKLWDNRKNSGTYGKTRTIIAGEDNPTITVIPPGVVHGYTNVSKTDGYVLNFPNRLYAGKGRKEPVDEVRYENATESGFVMT
jgi:dTDP-4-dehydrorhamnose 3,5-epimerase